MNDQGVDADHVAAPESGDTCTTPLRTVAPESPVILDIKPTLQTLEEESEKARQDVNE